MKSYQKKESKVKESIAILDQEKLLDTAAGGLLNLSIELGFEVMRQMLELDVETLAGKKGKHNRERTAYRHGSEPTKVVVGGRKAQCGQTSGTQYQRNGASLTQSRTVPE